MDLVFLPKTLFDHRREMTGSPVPVFQCRPVLSLFLGHFVMHFHTKVCETKHLLAKAASHRWDAFLVVQVSGFVMTVALYTTTRPQAEEVLGNFETI
jgi:hypothetical protein